jgi:osmotically-inducible protein OsmY
MREQTMTMATSDATQLDDETLAQQVYHALEDIKPLCVLGAPLHFQVSDGVVTLRGVVATYPCKAQLMRAVRGVRGVRKVCDELWM